MEKFKKCDRIRVYPFRGNIMHKKFGVSATIVLILMLIVTVNALAAENSEENSNVQINRGETEKNKLVLMGINFFSGSGNVIPLRDTSGFGRPIVQLSVAYRYYFYPVNFFEKRKNGLALDFGVLYSFQVGDKPPIGKEKALYFNSSVLYSLNTYGLSAYHHFLFNIGFTANIFLKKLKASDFFVYKYHEYVAYKYHFAQIGILMEIGYMVYTPDFQRSYVFKILFKCLTHDISPYYRGSSFIYVGFAMSLLFQTK